jgi:hypothetical protein
MRAYELPKKGAGIEALVRVERPDPKPAYRQVLVKVAACSLNFRDLGIVRGTYRMPVRDNIVPLADRAGEVLIVDLFERRFSADGVKHHKPSRQAYAYVEKELGAEPSQFCLIACHTSDTLGAVACRHVRADEFELQASCPSTSSCTPPL